MQPHVFLYSCTPRESTLLWIPFSACCSSGSERYWSVGQWCSIRRTVPTHTGVDMRRMVPMINSILALYDERLRSHRLQNGSPTGSARATGVRSAFHFVG